MSSVSNFDVVCFWKKGERPFGCFSQWYMSSFQDEENIKYNCAEQYMMAQKAKLFKDEDSCKLIMKSVDTAEMKKLGQGVKNFKQDVWEENRYKIVLAGTRYKFSQNEKLKEILLSTNNSTIVEASPMDKIWGNGMSAEETMRLGPAGTKKWGLNLLGKALIEYRDFLKESK